MKNWPKVMEFCDESWNFTNFAPKIYQFCMFFVTAKKLSSNLESPYFPMFSAKCREFKIGKRDGHGKSRNGHGKIFYQVCGNPVGVQKGASAPFRRIGPQ